MTELPPGASPVDAIEPGTRLREWEIVRFVGRGSYGVVFEARRSSWLDEPPRALKIFDPIISSAARSALLGEFSTLTDVHHPHLLAGIDAFDLVAPPYAGCVVFVLELADEDLSHRIARSGPLPPAEAAAVVADVADGLAALHAEGRIHGDVKPENILRAGDRWVLGDFGVTSVLEGSYAVTHAATIDYRPPEAAQGADGTRQHRSADVWALGVSLHVAATGRHPFPGPDPMMRYAAALRGDRAPAPGLDPGLATIIDDGCLVADRHQRLDAAGVAARLRAFGADAAQSGESALSSSPPPSEAQLSATTPFETEPSEGVPLSETTPLSATTPFETERSEGVPLSETTPLSATTPFETERSATTPFEAQRPSSSPPFGIERTEAPPSEMQRPSSSPPFGIERTEAPPSEMQRPSSSPPFGTQPSAAPQGGAMPSAPGSAAGRGWLVLALAVVATVVLTQVVAVASGALLTGVAARRAAYLVVSAGMLVAATAGYLRGAEGASSRPVPVVLAGCVAVTWLIATVVLFV